MDSYSSSRKDEYLHASEMYHSDGNYNNPHFYSIRSLLPYSNGDISVEPKKFTDAERESPNDLPDEELLNGYINRLLLTCSMEEAGEEDFPSASKENFDSSYSPGKRKPYKREKIAKQRRPDKKGRKYRKERKEEVTYEESPVTQKSTPYGPTITMTTEQFRRMVKAEIEAHAERIHHFYEFQWDQITHDRLNAYRSLVTTKEQNSKLEYLLMSAEEQIAHLHGLCDGFSKELDAIRDAKRKRRSAAKTRRNKKEKDTQENDENHQPVEET